MSKKKNLFSNYKTTLSKCCGAYVIVEGKTTMYYVCLKCKKACDTITIK